MAEKQPLNEQAREMFGESVRQMENFKKEPNLFKGIGVLFSIFLILSCFSLVGIAVICRMVLIPIVLVPLLLYIAYAINLLELMK